MTNAESIPTTDADLLIHGVAPNGRPVPAHLDWDGNQLRWSVRAVGTKVLGYIYPSTGGNPTTGYGQVITGYQPTTTTYRATDRDGTELGVAGSLRDAAALIVKAAHTPRRPGRPATGVTPSRSIRLGAVYDRAVEIANQRGDKLPAVLEQALQEYVASHTEDAMPTVDSILPDSTVR